MLDHMAYVWRHHESHGPGQHYFNCGLLLAGTRRPGDASRWAADPHAEALVCPGEVARQIVSGTGGEALF